MADQTTTDRTSDSPTASGVVADRPRPWGAPAVPAGPVAQVVELKDLVVAYAKQETVDPLLTLRRYMAFGLTGAFAIGVGLCFSLLALLRGLQEVELFNDPDSTRGGTWSFVPYLVVFLVGAVLAGLFLYRLLRFIQDKGSTR